ncbi:CatB-related O-acetyltransferase [Arcobacter sp.]|uniref:CatB-related O-acetyltransferase n=1 Tax=unclassified Arcobacter TaxID=2593671 RepID=UPI003AFF7CC8
MFNFFRIRLNRYKNKKRFPGSLILSNVYIDSNSSINKNSKLFQNVTVINSIIGNGTYLQSNTNCYYSDIGKYCSIGSNVTIGLASHLTNTISTSPIFYDCSQSLPFFLTKRTLDSKLLIPKTVIEHDVWIGQGAMIKAGVTIGMGSVIGAGAVVVKDVKPYSIVGGVPAKHIKYRFDEKVRNLLIDSQWWKLDEEILEELNEYFDNPLEFTEKVKKINND